MNVFSFPSDSICSFFIPSMCESNFFTRFIRTNPFFCLAVIPFNPIINIISILICCYKGIFMFLPYFSIYCTVNGRIIWRLIPSRIYCYNCCILSIISSIICNCENCDVFSRGGICMIGVLFIC